MTEDTFQALGIFHVDIDLLNNNVILRDNCEVQSMDDNCGEWVECMGVARGCGEQEVGVASGSGWNLWMRLLGVVVRRSSYYLSLLLLYLFFFCSSIPTFCSFFKCFFHSC